ncbi:Spermidine synthase [Symbiodinium microadriaticum]|uniref:Spermidine synthase n=1 Tax=Symbiodinium microadriaticum TaxID=2951 RepID=A0A1Q9EQD0_SYMMI|nr:Spermidine synthase [Symbiodinium microadriaticum]
MASTPVYANGSGKEHRGPGSLNGRTWQEQRAPALLDLLRAGELCDLVLLAGEPAERVPASRLLLAAASAAMYARAEASPIADEEMFVLKCPEPAKELRSMTSPASVWSYGPGGSLGSNAGSQFEQVAAPLASELLATLEQEHNREILTLYEEQVRLREELRRVVELMQQEVLPRERQLHDMFEKLNEAFHTSAQNLRRQQEEFHARASQMTQKHDMSRREMLDPLQAAETELTRIKTMLNHPLVSSPGLPPQLLQQIQQRVQQSYGEEIRVPMARRSESGQTCPGCGNTYADDSNFCRRCGLKRSQAPIFQPPSPAISGSSRTPLAGRLMAEGGLLNINQPANATVTLAMSSPGSPAESSRRKRRRGAGEVSEVRVDDAQSTDEEEEGPYEPVMVDEVLHEEQTEYQHLLVFCSHHYGRCLSLDGILQSTEKDEHIYHEHLVHVPLLLCGSPERVAICGGGNGGAAREALKHGVAEVYVIDIDPSVGRAVRRFLPSQGTSLLHPNVSEISADASDFQTWPEGHFDAILVDSTDMGMAQGRSDHLWSKSFFAGCLQRLKRGGILSTQLGACLLRPDGLALSPTVAAGLGRLKQAGFQTARAYTAEIPSYGGLAVFGMASNGGSQQESCLALLASSACRVAGRADATEASSWPEGPRYHVPPWRSRAAARGLEDNEHTYLQEYHREQASD